MLFIETIRAENGQLFHLDYHQRRLDRTREAFGITRNYPLSELLDPPKEGLIRCRVLYDAEQIDIMYLPYVVKHFHSLQAVIDDEIVYDYKYANRTALDYDYEEHGDADDVVIVKNGLLTDTSIANIALYDGEQWVTPKTPLLRGTTRERLLDEGKLVEADIPLSELGRYSRCAIMNAMIGFLEIENGIIPPK